MVLEAWYKAEKIDYPVVWEKTKDSSDVVDYYIRDEQTKDIFAEINANNQTTTGMATVIPWVNAPKLLAKTSVIIKENMPSVSFSTQFTSTDEWGWQKYTPISVSWWDAYWDGSSGQLIIPVKWTYMISFEGHDQQDGANPTTWWTSTYAIRKNWVAIATTTVAFRTRWHINWTREFEKWDIIEFYSLWSQNWYITRYWIWTISRVA